MLCKACGTENEDDAIFCKACGHSQSDDGPVEAEPVEEEPARQSNPSLISRIAKSKPIRIAIVAVVLLAVIVAAAAYSLRPSAKFARAFNAGDYEAAVAVYEDTTADRGDEENAAFDEYVISVVAAGIEDIAANFAGDPEVEATELSDAVECAKELGLAGEDFIDEAKETIKVIGDSRSSFSKAEAALEDQDYITASVLLMQVVSEDVLYSDAQELLKGAEADVIRGGLAEAEGLFNGGDVDEAIELLKTVRSIVADDQVAERIGEYEDFRTAERERAIAELEAKRDSLLGKFSKQYDDVTDTTRYLPKGYTLPFEIPRRGTLFFPLLVGDPNTECPTFKLLVAYNQDDWIFMENLACNGDGHRFSITFNQFDVSSDVGFGTGVYEWVEIPYTADSPLLSEMLGNANSNLVEDLGALAAAKKATVRLEGKYDKDVTLSQKQKTDLKNTIELYDACYELYGKI